MRPSGRVWADEVRDGDGGGWEGKEWADVEGLKSWVGPLMCVSPLFLLFFSLSLFFLSLPGSIR